MKNLIIVLAITFGFQLNILKADVELTNGKTENTVRLALNSTSAEAEIVLTDTDNYTLHRQVVQTENYQVSIDFSALPAGSYSLQVKESNDLVIEYTQFQIIIENGFTVIGEETSQIVYLPSIQKRGEMLWLNMLSLNKNTNVSAVFTDSKNNILHTDKFLASNSKGRMYSLETLPKGSYQVTLIVDGHETKHSFVK